MKPGPDLRENCYAIHGGLIVRDGATGERSRDCGVQNARRWTGFVCPPFPQWESLAALLFCRSLRQGHYAGTEKPAEGFAKLLLSRVRDCRHNRQAECLRPFA